jgi:hypothetical protein
MILSSGKHNRRRPARKKSGSGRTLLRALPRPRFLQMPRMPRGRAAVLAVAILIAGCLAVWQGALAYERGDLLTVSRVEVTGNRHWGTERLLEHAGLDIGLRVHEIPFRAARKSLLQLPGVESATIRYYPGGRVRVTVREAEVVAMRPTSKGWRGLTPAGTWMPLAAHAPEDVPVLEGRGLSSGTERTVAAWLAGVRARNPDVFAGFSQVSPRGKNGEADVYWRDGRVRLRVDCTGRGDGSLEYLAELLRREQAGWAVGATVDLRVEGYAYVL